MLDPRCHFQAIYICTTKLCFPFLCFQGFFVLCWCISPLTYLVVSKIAATYYSWLGIGIVHNWFGDFEFSLVVKMRRRKAACMGNYFTYIQKCLTFFLDRHNGYAGLLILPASAFTHYTHHIVTLRFSEVVKDHAKCSGSLYV